MSQEYVEISFALLIANSENGGLFEIEGKQHWLPWSQIEDNKDCLELGTEGCIYITEWIAAQRGIEH